MKKIVFLSLLLISLIPFSHAFADDTDLYILTQLMQQVPPDALIVLDLSGSMNYTPGEDTLYVDDHSHCTSNTYDSSYNGPYYSLSATGHTYQCTGIPQTGGPIYGDSSCSETTGFYRTSGTGHTADCSKVAIAKRAVFNFLDAATTTETPAVANGIINHYDQDYLKIRMGYMRFYDCSTNDTVNSTSYTSGCNRVFWPNPNSSFANSTYMQVYCNDSTSCTQSSPGSATSVAHESATGGTPLAAALQEAKYYFDYTKSSDNDAACRQKFAILITDGEDTYACSGNGQANQTNQYKRRRESVAQARALANAGYYVFVVGFGANMPHYQKNALNWMGYYGKTFNKDQTQSITNMYTIPYGLIYPSGITQCLNSSTSHHNLNNEGDHYYATTNDPGEYGISGYAFIAQNESQLEDAIMNIRNFIITLLAQSTSYVAPVVPISQFQSTSSENRMYLGMFKPTTTTMWKGNIKKYGIASTTTSTLSVGDVIDANNQLVLTPQNTIKTTAQSYWSSSADGGDVEKGGIGALLLAGNPDSRNIYTYFGTNTDLTNSSNAFSLSNRYPENSTGKITTTALGVTTTAQRDDIINFIHGWDAWSWNSGPGTKRDWILGAFIHSRPWVIHYASYDVIYAGANDGMLHAFKDTNGVGSDDGAELWAFIPPDLLPNLKNFNNSLTSVQIFVDGSPKAWTGTNPNTGQPQTILIFGERRGGNQYYALDVTDPSTPKFLWSISPSTAGYGELGQSWSTPIFGKIKNGVDSNGNPIPKWVAFIGGGYAAAQEDQASPPADLSGRAVYVIDITNGSQIWKYSHSNDSNMKYCIPSDITPIDVNGDGLIERLYVGDVGGEIWRFDIGDMTNTASWTGEIIFKGSGKIFYPPDVTFENNRGSGTYDMLFFGTGDREKPNNTTSGVNTLYAIKDYDTLPTPLTALIESSLTDVTSYGTPISTLQSSMGWFIRLNRSVGENPDPGEKCSGQAVVLGGAVYYTTFTPTPINTQTVCSLGTGSGNVYIMQYQTGNALFDLDNDTTISVTDRSMGVGAGIPSGIIIAIINGTVTGYGGVAGGVFSPQLTITNAIWPLDWRIAF